MTRSEKYELIKQTVADILEDYKPSYPLDSWELAKQMNICIKEFDNNDPLSHFINEGMFIFEKENAIVFVNTTWSNERIMFTIAHEIGHYILSPLFEEVTEQDANFFARFILAPPILIHQLKAKTKEVIVKKFGVSKSVAENSLNYYAKWIKFGPNEITDYEKKILNSQIKPKDKLNDKALLKLIPAHMLSFAEYTHTDGYPILSPYITSDKPPNKNKIIPFSKIKEVRKNLRDYFICFYGADDTFKKILSTPEKYVEMFADADGLIGFDFSIHTNAPKLIQKYSMFVNNALCYYYGENYQIPIIPNIRYGDLNIAGDYFESLPTNTYVAIGTHGFIHTKEQQLVWRESIKLIIEKLHPVGIVVYGPHPASVFLEFEKQGQKFFYNKPWERPRTKNKSTQKNIKKVASRLSRKENE